MLAQSKCYFYLPTATSICQRRLLFAEHGSSVFGGSPKELMQEEMRSGRQEHGPCEGKGKGAGVSSLISKKLC